MELSREQFIELRTVLKICLYKKQDTVFNMVECLLALDDESISNYVTHYMDERIDCNMSLRAIAPQMILDIETELILG